jgi:hypothetical protein
VPEHLGNGQIADVVAGDRRDVGSEIRLRNASPGCEDSHTGVGKTDGNAASHAAAGAGHERNLFTQSAHVTSPDFVTCLRTVDRFL